jgi:hypothetical protein
MCSSTSTPRHCLGALKEQENLRISLCTDLLFDVRSTTTIGVKLRLFYLYDVGVISHNDLTTPG